MSANIWNEGRKGFQCVSVCLLISVFLSPLVAKGSQVFPDDDQFNATWFWKDGRDSVRSYPHAKFHSKELPARLSSIEKLSVQGIWSAKAAPQKYSRKSRTLDSVKATFNVAIDMFMHHDPQLSQNETTAQYEIMVWVGNNRSPKPLGHSDGVKMVQRCGDHRL